MRWPSASSGIDFSHLAGYKFLTVRTLARRWTSAEMSRLPRCDWRTTNPVTYSVKPPWFLKSPLSASYPRFMHDAVTPTSCRRWHTEWHKHLLSVEHRMSCVGEDGSPPRRPSSKSPSDVTRLFCQCPSTSPPRPYVTCHFFDFHPLPRDIVTAAVTVLTGFYLSL